MIKKRLVAFSEKLAKFDKKYPDKISAKKAKQDGAYISIGVGEDLIYDPYETTPNLVSSVASDAVGNFHYPVLDMDFPVYAVPSRTPGHTHLYIDKKIPHKKYMKLLDALLEAELIEHGYWENAKQAGESFLRIDSYNKLLALEEKHQKEKELSETAYKKYTPKEETNLPAHKGEIYFPTKDDPIPWGAMSQAAKAKGFKWAVPNYNGGGITVFYEIDANHSKALYLDDIPEAPSPFKVGDQVKVVKADWNPKLVGLIGAVVAVNFSGNWGKNQSPFVNQTIVTFENPPEEFKVYSAFGFQDHELEVVNQSDIEEVKQFKIGDEVMITNQASNFYKETGVITKIFENKNFPYKVKFPHPFAEDAHMQANFMTSELSHAS